MIRMNTGLRLFRLESENNMKKKLYYILGASATLILLAIYLFALTRRGVWHGDTFLYLQKDETYAGEGLYYDYHMSITEKEDGTDILFSVDDMAHSYFVQAPDRWNILIYEDEELIFDGSYQYGFMMSDDEELDIQIVAHTSSTLLEVPKKEELFPSKADLYEWATMVKPGVRGNFGYVICLALALIVLAVDVCFPDFFFHLRHFLHVEGGTPTDFYRISQWIGRVIMIIMAIVCIFKSLTPM